MALLVSNDNLIQGNYIGTDDTGELAFANGTGISVGIFFFGNTIGGTSYGAGNVISGNTVAGILLDLGDSGPLSSEPGNVIQGNLIGVDATGTKAIGNRQWGIALSSSAPGNLIGGDSAAARNVISGNGFSGIEIDQIEIGLDDSSPGNIIENNFIGTDITGKATIGNGQYGILLAGPAASDTTIGAPNAGNLISGNGLGGVFGGSVSSVVVQDNLIGTNVTGTSSLGNAGDGVELSNGSSDNTIGGTSSGDGNVIAFNTGNGITIGYSATDDSTGDAILENSIFANSKLGIDLGDNGVTLNDSSGHSGPNLFQDFPVLTSASTYNGATAISGTLSGAADTAYELEFFSNPAADPSGYGQGQAFLMATSVTTDSSGDASFSVDSPTVVTVGQYITATATDPAGNTSEFSADAVVTNTPPLPALVPKSITAISPNPRNTPVSSVQVTFNEPVNLATFTTSALTLTDNGGSNLISSAVTISLVSGATYQLSGLSGLTAAEGNYTLTVNAADIQDQNGNPGSGTVSTSWLMDTTPPTSTLNALLAQTTTTSFAITVTGSDPSGANGSTPSGVASYAIFESKDNGAFTLFATVTPASPSASFTGQAGNTYGFYSVATDNAGNVQATPAAAQTTVSVLSPLAAISITAIAPNPRNIPISTAQVAFNQPVNLATFTSSALTLTDNGGSNLITSAVTISLVSGSTYQISGLSGLTSNNGNYALTVNSADIQDTYGNPGSGTIKTTWLMDTTPPTSHVNALAARHEPELHRLGQRIRWRLAGIGREVVRHLLLDQRRSVVALDERAGFHSVGHVHRAEQYDLFVLQHRP